MHFFSTMRTLLIAKVIQYLGHVCIWNSLEHALKTHHLVSGAEFNTTSLDFIQVALNGL